MFTEHDSTVWSIRPHQVGYFQNPGDNLSTQVCLSTTWFSIWLKLESISTLLAVFFLNLTFLFLITVQISKTKTEYYNASWIRNLGWSVHCETPY